MGELHGRACGRHTHAETVDVKRHDDGACLAALSNVSSDAADLLGRALRSSGKLDGRVGGSAWCSHPKGASLVCKRIHTSLRSMQPAQNDMLSSE